MNLGLTVWLDILRVGHILSAILWIGLLYYFNFVQVPSFAKMDPAARQNAIMNLVPRALMHFRYAALGTLLFGLLYVITIGTGTDGYWQSHRFYNILIGGGLGIIMFLNVWFIIWPTQKKIIAATTAPVVEKKPAPPEQAGWNRQGFLASRTNVMLSIPMLFFMVAAVHLPQLWN